jgi:site-specific DNA-cytosine methylase
MAKPRKYGLLTFYCGLGLKTLGFLQARGGQGSRFESVGAFDIDEDACTDFHLLTGARAQVADLGVMTPQQLVERCSRRPDAVIMSPPCKGLSGCMGEEMAQTEKYQEMNALTLRSIDLVLEAWLVPPAFILLENVPRITSARGAKFLAKIRVLLRAKGYELDEDTHDCGEVGGLAQSRVRYLLVARHRKQAPSVMLRPERKPLRSMAEVLWQLPAPTPDNRDGGPMHRLPRLSALNWLRLASIRAGKDWNDLPSAIGLSENANRHAGIYGPQDPSGPAHTIIGQSRTGKGVSDVADPRLSPRAMRQNGGFGVNDGERPAHAVVAEGTVRNTWASVTDPRSVCSRHEWSLGVSSPTHNSTSSVAPRVKDQRRGAYEVLDPSKPAKTIRGRQDPRVAPSAVADGSKLFQPTHRLRVDQALPASRADWTSGTFVLEGPLVEFGKKGSPCHMIIEAPDGTVHRPLTTLECGVLQSISPWHRPGDPTEMEIGDEGGQWLELTGKNDAGWRERIGNAVPRLTAKAIGNVVLEILDAGATEVFRLSAGGVWVAPELVGAEV